MITSSLCWRVISSHAWNRTTFFATKWNCADEKETPTSKAHFSSWRKKQGSRRWQKRHYCRTMNMLCWILLPVFNRISGHCRMEKQIYSHRRTTASVLNATIARSRSRESDWRFFVDLPFAVDVQSLALCIQSHACNRA